MYLIDTLDNRVTDLGIDMAMCWIRQSVEGRGKDLSSRVRKTEISAASGMNASVENKGAKIQDRKLWVCQHGWQKLTSVKGGERNAKLLHGAALLQKSVESVS